MAVLTCADLIRQGRNLSLPFELEVTVGNREQVQTSLVITQLFRLMPGKRLVGLTTWNDEPALIKLFYQPHHWQRHLEREHKGNRNLMEARVSTPPLLETGTTSDGKAALLLNRFLADAVNLGELLASGELSLLSNDLGLLEKLIALLSRCHEKGVWQQDIHLDNFILHEGRIYFLDGADVNVETLGAALGETRSLDNLAWFFAQFPVHQDAGIGRLFQHYCQCRSARQFRTSEQDFLRLVRDARRQRLANYRKKLLRSTTAHLAIRTAQDFMVVDRELLGAELDRLVADPDSYIESGQVIKAGNTCTVALIDLNGRKLVLKRYNIKSFLHRLKRLFGRSRAESSWCSALQLRMLGIGTARPLMMLEQRSLGILRGKAWFLAEFVPGENLLQGSAALSQQPSGLDQLMGAFGELFQAMQIYHFTHGDMKESNFIFRDGRLAVLDLDAMVWHEKPAAFAKAFNKDLQRFARNWNDKADMEAIADRAHNVMQEFLAE